MAVTLGLLPSSPSTPRSRGWRSPARGRRRSAVRRWSSSARSSRTWCSPRSTPTCARRRAAECGRRLSRVAGGDRHRLHNLMHDRGGVRGRGARLGRAARDRLRAPQHHRRAGHRGTGRRAAAAAGAPCPARRDRGRAGDRGRLDRRGRLPAERPRPTSASAPAPSSRWCSSSRRSSATRRAATLSRERGWLVLGIGLYVTGLLAGV